MVSLRRMAHASGATVMSSHTMPAPRSGAPLAGQDCRRPTGGLSELGHDSEEYTLAALVLMVEPMAAMPASQTDQFAFLGKLLGHAHSHLFRMRGMGC